MKKVDEMIKDKALWAGLNSPDLTIAEADIVTFGIPFDGGVSFRSGTRNAPEALRNITYTISPTSETLESFEDLKIRDLGIDSIKPGIEAWTVDRKVRNEIIKAGFGDNFTHRSGHSIDTDVHGTGANLDDYEVKETRLLMPGLIVSMEPGIYLRGEFGVRSEVDVMVTKSGSEVTTSIQRELLLLG